MTNDKIIHLEISFRELLWLQDGLAYVTERWKLYLENNNDDNDLFDLPGLKHFKERLNKEIKELLK